MTNSQKTFFDHVRRSLFKGSLRQSQVEGLIIILDAMKKHCKIERDMAAYILGTAFHETARTMQPLREYGRGRGRPYGKKNAIVMAGKTQRVKNDHIYYGRGYVQLTWFDNYLLQTNKIGVDFVSNPDLAMVPEHAADILVGGMYDGDFTGQGLPKYFAGAKHDWKGARRIVNGTDKAYDIGEYAKHFYRALRAAGI